MKLPKNSTGKFTQHKKNFPLNLKQKNCFFPVTLSTDGIFAPANDDWKDPLKLKTLSAFNESEIVGFNIVNIWNNSYLFLYFKNVFVDGAIIESAEKIIGKLKAEFDIHIEYDPTRKGAQTLLNPSDDKFTEPINETLYFTDKRTDDSPQLQLFYKTDKIVVLTGDKLKGSGANIPTNEINDKEEFEPKVDDFLLNLLDKIDKQKKTSPTFTFKDQHRENFPAEFLTAKRFVPYVVTWDDKEKKFKKHPTLTDWSNPDKQKTLAELKNKIVAIDCNGYGNRIYYLILDLDHILIDGKFVNAKVAEFVKNLLTLFPNIYIAYSVSRTGLHIFLKPTATAIEFYKQSITKSFYFSDNHTNTAPHAEVYFNTSHCFVLTGNKFSDGAEIPEGAEVDKFFRNLLVQIELQQPKKTTETRQDTKKNFDTNNFSNSPSEQERALAMLDKIPCSDLIYDNWVRVGMILKTNGNTLADWEHWSANDERFKNGECAYKWKGFKDNGGLTIATLHDIAKIYKYSENDFRRQWHKDHPNTADSDFDNIDAEKISLLEQLRDANKKIADFDARKESAFETLKNVQDFSYDSVMTDEILTAAAFAYLYNKKVFKNFSDAIKNQIKLKKIATFIQDWKDEVKTKAKDLETEYSKLKAEKNAIQAKINNFNFVADNPEWQGFLIPENYSVSDNEGEGVTKIVGEKSIPVCSYPVGIKSKLFNTDTKTFKWILNFKIDGKWQDLVEQAASNIFDSRKIISLVDYDLPVSSVNNFVLVEYLKNFKETNHKKIPLVYVIPRCGWYEYKDQEFFIDPRRKNSFVTDEGKRIEIIPDSSNVFTKNLTSKGTIEEWKKAYDLAKTSPIARFFVAGSVAPALLKVLNERKFVLYIYGKTTGGKTTALLLGASIVGNSKIVRTFEGSSVALKSAAVDANYYPFLVDEKQQADAKLKADFVSFIYLMADTHEKTRADTSGKSTESREAENITLATGETVAINDNATGGAYTRLLQIKTPKILLDATTCKDIRDIIKKNYGVVYPAVIDKIFEIGFEQLNELYSDFVKLFQASNPDILSEYCRYVAMLTVADTLLNVVLGSDFETARLDAQDNANKIFPLIPTKAEIDDTEREKVFVLNFISAKAAQFENSFTYRKNAERIIGDTLGSFDFDTKFVYISTSALKQACKDSGFDEKKLVADLIDDKFFIAGKIQKGKNKADNNHSVRLNGTKTRCYKIPLQFVQGDDLD